MDYIFTYTNGTTDIREFDTEKEAKDHCISDGDHCLGYEEIKDAKYFPIYCEPNAGITFSWGRADTGFGQFYFYVKDKELYCDNEMMSKDFVKEMLCHMVDSATFTER